MLLINNRSENFLVLLNDCQVYSGFILNSFLVDLWSPFRLSIVTEKSLKMVHLVKVISLVIVFSVSLEARVAQGNQVSEL